MADMTIANAAATYAANASVKVASPAVATMPAATGASEAGQSNFASMVSDALSSVRDASGKAEQQSLQSIQGNAPLHDVVAAVSNAEVTLQTVVAVRDRVISAYQDIIRMPI